MAVLEHHQIRLVWERKTMSSNDNVSISEPVSLCKKCGYVRIYWIEDNKVPFEWENQTNSSLRSVFAFRMYLLLTNLLL